MNRFGVRRLRRKIFQRLIHVTLVRGHESDNIVRLGSQYGGWWIPTYAARVGAAVVSAGVGEDTSFDEEMLKRGCDVWAVDPTPRALLHVERRTPAMSALPGRFHFYPIGLWHRSETQRFYAPSNASHVSHSIKNLQDTNEWFDAECWSLAQLLLEIGVGAPDVLKLDIEGAEVEVLKSVVQAPAKPAVLCVELDDPLPEVRTLRLLRQLRRSGYRLAHAEGWNMLLLQDSYRSSEGGRDLA